MDPIRNPLPSEDLTVDQLAAFRRAEPEALRDVYRRYGRAVWSVAMSTLRDPSLADDATQETFLRAWRNADRFDSRRPIAPWLFTIARRTAIDVHRREHRPTRGDHEPQTDLPVEDPGLEHAWTMWQVRLALDTLPEAEQQVLELTYFGGLSQSEIAQHLAVPLGTVKSRASRAHKRLAPLLHHLRPPAHRTAESSVPERPSTGPDVASAELIGTGVDWSRS